MLDFPGGAVVKNLPVNAGDTGSGFNPQVGKIPGAGNGNPPSNSAWKISWTEELGGYSP